MEILNNRNRRNLHTRDFCTRVMYVNYCKARTRNQVPADVVEEVLAVHFRLKRRDEGGKEK
jgi:hypothetical protein